MEKINFSIKLSRPIFKMKSSRVIEYKNAQTELEKKLYNVSAEINHLYDEFTKESIEFSKKIPQYNQELEVANKRIVELKELSRTIEIDIGQLPNRFELQKAQMQLKKELAQVDMLLKQSADPQKSQSELDVNELKVKKSNLEEELHINKSHQEQLDSLNKTSSLYQQEANNLKYKTISSITKYRDAITNYADMVKNKNLTKTAYYELKERSLSGNVIKLSELNNQKNDLISQISYLDSLTQEGVHSIQLFDGNKSDLLIEAINFILTHDKVNEAGGIIRYMQKFFIENFHNLSKHKITNGDQELYSNLYNNLINNL